MKNRMNWIFAACALAAMLGAGSTAYAVWLPGSCEPALLGDLEVGQWVFVFDDADDGMRIGRVQEIRDHHALVRNDGTTETLEAAESDLGIPNVVQRHILEFTRGPRERRARKLVDQINAGGGAARVYPEDTSLVMIDRAPRAGVIADDTKKRSANLAFNHPGEIDAAIALVNDLGGPVLYIWPSRFAGRLGQVDLKSEVGSGTVEFNLALSPRITRAALAHEMIHVDDMIANPLPELTELLNASQVPAETWREVIRRFGLSDRLIGVAETRAHRLGDEPALRGRPWYDLERLSHKMYYFHNRRFFHRGNLLLEPSFKHLFKWLGANGRYYGLKLGPWSLWVVDGYLIYKFF